MSGHRVYFKNDNFYMATQKQNERKEKQIQDKRKEKQMQKQKKYKKGLIYGRKFTKPKTNESEEKLQEENVKRQKKIEQKGRQIIQMHSQQKEQDLFTINENMRLSKYEDKRPVIQDELQEMKNILKRKKEKNIKKQNLLQVEGQQKQKSEKGKTKEEENQVKNQHRKQIQSKSGNNKTERKLNSEQLQLVADRKLNSQQHKLVTESKLNSEQHELESPINKSKINPMNKSANVFKNILKTKSFDTEPQKKNQMQDKQLIKGKELQRKCKTQIQELKQLPTGIKGVQTSINEDNPANNMVKGQKIQKSEKELEKQKRGYKYKKEQEEEMSKGLKRVQQELDNDQQLLLIKKLKQKSLLPKNYKQKRTKTKNKSTNAKNKPSTTQPANTQNNNIAQNTQQNCEKEQQIPSQNNQDAATKDGAHPLSKKKSNKKIKKVNNYQRLDLKRRFKDKFVGGLKQNQKKYMKNGVLKHKYRTLQSELQFQNGQVHNTYIHSLSKSFFLDINIDSDSQIQQKQNKSSQNLIEIPSIPQCNYSNLTMLLKNMFGFQNFRQGQYQVISNILNKKSSIFIAETASGKSLTYILSSFIMAYHFQGMSIVISPLIALMLDQLQHLPIQISAACISSLLTYEQRNKILDMVKKNQIKLLFLTPQTLNSDLLFHIKHFPKVNFVCIDQAHCLSQLSHNFRTSYLALAQIILHQINYNNEQEKANILCLTATANIQTINSLQKKLKINQVIKSSSTINKNLFITITRQIGSENKFRSLVQYLTSKQIQKCQGAMIYCRSKYLIEKVFNYLHNSNIPCSIFHGSLANKQKTDIITQFKQKSIKIIITTTALGMGLDFQHLDCIVHFNMPKSLESFVQEVGRAGRRLRRAYCHLFLDESDFLMERNYILADQLQKDSLETIISYIKRAKYNIKDNKPSVRQVEQKNESNQLQMQRVIKMSSMKIQKMESDNKDSMVQVLEDLDDYNPFEDDSFISKNQSQNQGFSTLYYIRVKELSQKTYLREEALLTIIIKISNLLNQQLQQTSQNSIIKILPLSHEILKLSFFKSNQNALISNQKHSSFYKALVDIDQGQNMKSKSKKVNGTYHIPLISKCNQMKLTPIQLLTKLYEISNQYVLKVQFVNQVYLFSVNQKYQKHKYANSQFKNIVDKLKDYSFRAQIIKQVNQIQKTSMTKLNVFYSLAFNYSQINVSQLIKRKLILSRKQQLSKDNIMNEISKYFNTELNNFYSYITQTEDQFEKQVFLPTEIIDTNERQGVYDYIKLFFKHQFSNLRDISNKEEALRKKEQLIKEFQDGKIITRVFLGVSEEKSSRQIYGQHTYWRKFIKKKYNCLLKTVRELIELGKQDLLQN